MHSFFSPKSGGKGLDPFQELLQKLQAEHTRQVEGLHGRIQRLTHQLTQLGFTPVTSDHHDEIEATKSSDWSPHAAFAEQHHQPNGHSFHPEDCCRATASGEVLELKGVWEELMKHHSRRHSDIRRLTDKMCSIKNQVFEEADERDSEELPGPCLVKLCRYGVISPNSTWRLYWECTGLFLVCFDMINIPLSTVYEPPENTFSNFMDWTTLLFWTTDMLQAFFVGFYAKGHLVLAQPQVVVQYLKGWFLLDALVVIPDWFLTTAGTNTQAGDLSRLLRTSRAMRVLRLLRVMKLQRVINKLYDMIDNEYSFIIAELVKMMMVILVLNHVIACGWFGIGKIAHYQMGLPSWIVWKENFLESDIGYQYSTSLHWTLTQFTPASMDVVARNILERIYSIIVLLFAMVAFSSIVGTVTSSMTVIRQMKNDKQKQFWMLRRFLKQKNVSMDLTMRMTRFLEHQAAKQQKLIQAGKVSFLQQLSDQLARELAYEMYEPCLRRHAFFLFLCKELKGVAARICQMALKAIQVATEDTIFSVGEEATKAFIIKGGDMGYAHGEGQLLMPPPQEKEWLAEAVIWTQWRYRGKFFAVKPSDLLSLEAGRFAEAVAIHPKPVSIARHYGQKFVRLLNSQSPSQWSDILRDPDFLGDAVDEVGKQAVEEGLLSFDENNESEELNGHAQQAGQPAEAAEERWADLERTDYEHEEEQTSPQGNNHCPPRIRRPGPRCFAGLLPCSVGQREDGLSFW